MTPDQLKNSILQLAIQGKLTEEFRAQSEEHREDPFSQPNGCQLPQQQSFGGASSLAPTRSAPKKLGEVSRSDERGLIDLSAEELLVRIQAEKAELIKQGKVKKDKNESTIIKRGNSYFEKVGTTEKCIDDELPFEIPDSWLWVKLDELAIKEIRRGKSPKYAEKGSAFAFAQKCNSKHEGIKLDLALYLDDSSLKRYSEEEAIIDKDIIINSTGTGTLGRIGFYKESFNVLKAKYYPDSHVTVLRVSKNILPEFVFACLKYHHPWLEKQGEGSTNQKELKPHTIKNLPIPLPPLAEQHRIVAKIEELLPMVEKYGEAYNKLEALNKSFPSEIKKSILQYAIQGKLVEQRPEEGTAEELHNQIQAEKAELIKQGKLKKDKNESTIIKHGNSYFEKVGTTEKCIDDELPFEIPDSWRWARLGSCGVFTRGSGIKRNETVEKGLPCIRYGQLYTTYKTRFAEAVSFIPKELYDKCQKIHKNDILMALTGENNFDIALAVAYEGNEELAMGGDMTKFSNHCMNPLYLVYVINSIYGISCKSKLATGNIIVHISNDKLASILIPLPPLAEQHRIVAKIEELFAYVDTLSNKS